ncbi:hypothetical protein BRYFOR_09152 [Marvinbryantia formatexigens DSM 14469]|uniref:Uncharacterized protein n=1 Tax=Marvinbryantia formatexigens DSM 14469 TaxID=478749 RepID=C6LKG5_9FIRM|nr:hypothetical protein BRYFOR_09152 [Marvinbryantia formatexigens DSM 14469]
MKGAASADSGTQEEKTTETAQSDQEILVPFLLCAILIFILALTVAVTRFGKK